MQQQTLEDDISDAFSRALLGFTRHEPIQVE